MLRLNINIIFLLFLSAVSFSQVRVIKPVVSHSRSTKIGIGVGVTRSVLYLARNVKKDNDATGLNTTLVYNFSSLLRGSLEYTFYRSLDIAPTWYDVKAHTIEANMQFIARFTHSKSYFYPLLGLSYNIFSGYYTGVNDFLNLSSIYSKNKNVTTRWLGLNVGMGYEHFLKHFSVFTEYKMRIGRTEGYNEVNIQDVCISAGLRFNIRTRSLYRIFSGTRSRYLLDREESD